MNYEGTRMIDSGFTYFNSLYLMRCCSRVQVAMPSWLIRDFSESNEAWELSWGIATLTDLRIGDGWALLASLIRYWSGSASGPSKSSTSTSFSDAKILDWDGSLLSSTTWNSGLPYILTMLRCSFFSSSFSMGLSSYICFSLFWIRNLIDLFCCVFVNFKRFLSATFF